jgi:hypothetical protein
VPAKPNRKAQERAAEHRKPVTGIAKVQDMPERQINFWPIMSGTRLGTCQILLAQAVADGMMTIPEIAKIIGTDEQKAKLLVDFRVNMSCWSKVIEALKARGLLPPAKAA